MSKSDVAAGRAYVSLYVKYNEFQKALQKAKAEMKKFGSEMLAVGASIGTAGSGLLGLLAFPLKLAVNNEKAIASFSTLLGSTDAAKKLIQDLTDFAASTPFEMNGIQDAATKLLAFGSSQGNITKELRTLGDIASGVQMPLEELAELYGKARVQGRLFGEDINQITGRGIPIIGALAKQFGVAESEIKGMVEKGKVNFQDLEKAFASLAGNGGQFAGMMESQSKTVAGRWSTMIDDIKAAILPIGEAILPVVSGVMKSISQLVKQIGTVIAKNKGYAVAFAAVATTVATLGFAVMALGVAFSGMAVVIGGFSAAIAFVGTVLSAVGAVIAKLATPIGLLTIALVASGVSFVRFTETGRTAVATLVNSVTTLLGNVRKTFTDTFGGISEAIQAGDLSLAGQIAMVGLQLVFQQGLEAVNDLFGESIGKIISQLLSGDFVGAWGTVGSVVLDTWANVTSGIIGLMTNATNKIADLWADTVNKITNQILQLASEGGFFGDLFNSISGVDMQAETARAARLEAERRKLGLQPQTDGIDSQIAAGNYKDPGVEAIRDRIKQITAQIDEGRNAITNATGQAVADATGNQSEQTSANIKRLQEELARLRQEAKKKLEDGKKEALTGKQEQAGKGPGSTTTGTLGAASAASFNLMALQSAIMSPQSKQVKLAEEANKKQDKQIGIQQEVLANIKQLGMTYA